MFTERNHWVDNFRVRRSHLRSVSEANLLSSDCYSDSQNIGQIRRDIGQMGKIGIDIATVTNIILIAREGYDNHALADNERSKSRLRKSRESLLHNPRGQAGLRSRAASQLSVASRQSKPVKLGGISYR